MTRSAIMRRLSDDEARQTFIKTLAAILRRMLGLEAPKRRTSFARDLPALPDKSRRSSRKK